MPTVPLATLEPRRVCLVKPSALGDVVHALPVLDALARRWPAARFSWLVSRGLAGLVQGHPKLDDVILFDRPRPSGLPSFARFCRDLGRRGFDLTIDLQGLFRSGLMTRSTGAPVRVGRADAREGATFFYTHRVESTRTHAVDRLLDIAAAFGADISDPVFRPVIAESDRDWARQALEGVPRPRLAVNVGAQWETKRWPPRSFAAVAARAARELGAGIVAVGSSGDRPLVDEFLTALGEDGHHARDLCGRTSLPGLAAVAEQCDLFLSNDTGPLHLASAAGAPTVSVFLCTDPAKTGAYSPDATVVSTRIWCAARCIKTCDRLECMTELHPDRVWQAVSARLLTPSTRG